MRYEAPSTVAEAASLLAGEDGLARVLAGGTDLLVRMRSGMEEPDLIVDIKRIDGMCEIVKDGGGWRIGAGVSGAEMNEHAELKEDYPGVVEAVDLIGSTQIQGRATMSGNLCNSSPAADSVPAMVAAKAMVNIVGPSGERSVPAGEFCTGPGKNVLAKGELVASVSLPAKAAGTSDAYLRFIPRTEMDIAVVGCGVSLTMANGTCTAAKVALGAVGPTVITVDAAADALVGSKVDDTALEKLAAACSAAASPIDDKRGTVAFRTHVAGVLARRAAVIARDRAEA